MGDKDTVTAMGYADGQSLNGESWKCIRAFSFQNIIFFSQLRRRANFKEITW